MKYLLVFFSALLITVSASAAEIGETYLSPAIGYHFFDNDHNLDDKIEGGIRLGYFFMNDHSVELEGGYTSTDHDTEGSTGVTSLSVNALKFFDISDYYKPYIFLGAGGLFHENDMGSLVAGIGARFIMNEKISFDARVKDMLHSIGARNDIIPSVSLNVHFGGTPAPVYKEESEPEKEKPEEKMAEAEKREKKAESAAVMKKDSDGDGVYDNDDMCPGTPAGYPVNSAGCAVDSDGDGVFDFMDKCWTAKGLPVDKTGCTPDSDNDGVYDFEDRCPNTVAGADVNSAGCIVAVELKINFANNSAEVSSDYSDEIKDFVSFLKLSDKIHVEIQGHTDSKGTYEYNKALSQKRADAVLRILVDKYGIDSSRLSAVGYGESLPAVANDTPENMHKNRRIVTVIKQ